MSLSFKVGQAQIRIAGRTDVGQVRALNEDNLVIAGDRALCAVADGMGGHACGEVASQIAVDTVDEYYRNSEDADVITWPFRVPHVDIQCARMSSAIMLANHKIYESARADAQKHGMGCTVDSIYFSRGRYYIGHVGDSRVYLLRNGQLQQLTEDHSLLNDYKHMKEMTPEEIEHFPHKNIVVRALGLAENVKVDVATNEFASGDRFLLCSDGLNDMINDVEIRGMLAAERASLDDICDNLVRAANTRGGKDNITAIVADCKVE